MVCEQAYAQRFSYRYYQPFNISKRLSFVCSTPDFVISTSGLTIIEIKTCTQLNKGRKISNSMPNEYILQVWTSMETFGISPAHVYIYPFEEKSKRLNKFNNPKFVHLYGILQFTIEYAKIFEDILDLSSKRHAEFLEHFFKVFDIQMSNADKTYALTLIKQHFENHRRVKSTTKSVNRLVPSKKIVRESNMSYRFANFWPQDEKWGTESRKLHHKEFFKDVNQNLRKRKIQIRNCPVRISHISLKKNLPDSIIKGVY
jgi:hypothetical protein